MTTRYKLNTAGYRYDQRIVTLVRTTDPPPGFKNRVHVVKLEHPRSRAEHAYLYVFASQLIEL